MMGMRTRLPSFVDGGVSALSNHQCDAVRKYPRPPSTVRMRGHVPRYGFASTYNRRKRDGFDYQRSDGQGDRKLERINLESRQRLDQRLVVLRVITRRQIIMRVTGLLVIVIMAGRRVRSVTVVLKRKSVSAVMFTLKTTHRLHHMHPRHRQQSDGADKDARRAFHERRK